ncbi:MAG: cyclase family protein [Planctomycetota bacterium]
MKVLDCTLTLREGMRGVAFETAMTVEKEGWNARTLHLYSHCGTHMDSPLHFAAGDQTIDQIPLGDCIGSAVVADVRDIPDQQPIRVSDLGKASEQVQPGDALLFKSGWSDHVDQPDHYRDRFPPISEELALWLVDRKVRLIGVEPPSVADVNNLEAVTRIHKILLGAGVIIVEGLCRLDEIPSERCLFGAMPIKVAEGDGAPCRAFVILDESS